MFLQHAFSCHVCHRSLLFIPIKPEKQMKGGRRKEGRVGSRNE